MIQIKIAMLTKILIALESVKKFERMQFKKIPISE